jgi:ATP-binding cassette subfamily F protein 3
MLDDISRAAFRIPELELRSLLGCFLFSGDDVFKPLGVLSGGERNRFALARILVSPSNFLLLDEPTNHLDMRAKDVLLEAIESFSGTVIFVSHDRYFLDRLATKVFEIKDGTLLTYPGNYSEYVRDQEEAAAAASKLPTTAPAPQTAAAAPAPAESPKDTTPDPAKVRRLNPIKLKQMQDRCAFLEEEVPRIESSIAHTESQLGNYVSADETQRQTTLLDQLRAQLHTSTTEWEELMIALEEQEELS